MTTSNEKIRDGFTSHQTSLLRYAAGLRNDGVKILKDSEEELFDTLFLLIAKYDGGRTLTGKAGKTFQRKLQSEVKRIRKKAWDRIGKLYLSEFKSLSKVEAKKAADIVDKFLPVVVDFEQPKPNKLSAIIGSMLFEANTLKQWISRSSNADIGRIVSRVKIGIGQGETPGQITNSIFGTKTNRRGSILSTANRNVDGIASTVTIGVSNESRQEFYIQNPDVFKQEIYQATLDSRTTLECASNDGELFDIGKGPMPPLHFNCRSFRDPYINPESLTDRKFKASSQRQLLREYSKQSNIASVKNRSDLPRGHKGKFDTFAKSRMKELVGTVPGKTTFEQFLRGRSTEFQRDYLGPTRYEMFKNGKLSLSNFVAPDGTTLTLAQLANKGLDVPD